MSRTKPDPKLFRISIAGREEEIGNCYETMRALRTELSCREKLVTQIKRQQNKVGYVL